jgi:IS5 family transposase
MVNAQPTLWDTILPEACLGLPDELEAVDRLLDDAVFFEPYRDHFHATLGRPSVPIETYLRLMFLKYRYRLGYEPLCREVADSISWQRFCRIPLGSPVPHPTTLMKITTRCGHGRGVECGVVGQGRRREGPQGHPGARGHDRGGGQRGVPERPVRPRRAQRRTAAHGQTQRCSP